MNASFSSNGGAGMARANSSARIVGKLGLGVAALAAAVTIAGISAARAGMVYQDNFGRTGNLAGSSPAPTDATASTWTVYSVPNPGTTPTTNGSAAVFADYSNVQAALLPFTPQANATYAFTATITPAAGTTGNWLGMGFGNSTSTAPTGNINNADTEAWLLYRDNGETEGFYGGYTNNTVVGGSASTGGIADTFTLTLTTPANLATGTASVSMYDSLDLIGSSLNPQTVTLTAAELANVDSIILGSYQTGGTFTSLELSGPIPEPATSTLLVMGGLGLLLVRRRKMA